MLQTLSSQLATMANNNTPTTTLGQNTPGSQPGPQAELTARPRPKLPDVPIFEGKETEFRTWINQIKRKLIMDILYYPINNNKFTYIYLRLKNKMANIITLYIKR